MVRIPDRHDALRGIDAATMRRLLEHEARVHSTPGRVLRDLGDGLMLHDPLDPEPFWNRFEAVRWPDEPAAFDRRLDELLVLFASLGRRPHVWASPGHDAPGDLVARLTASGFEDVGPGVLMLLVDPSAPEQLVRQVGGADRSVEVERWHGLAGDDAAAAAEEIVEVLLEAFGVEESRSGPIRAETIASLGHAWYTHYLVRWRGTPAAVARRATFDGLTYLSSIGTVPAARGRGFAQLVTAAAARDAAAAGSEYVTLGAFAENDRAIRLYRRVGFETLGNPAPDLLLVG
jgi:ribosomal protein S18 acetylase RimI-like enzyme